MISQKRQKQLFYPINFLFLQKTGFGVRTDLMRVRNQYPAFCLIADADPEPDPVSTVNIKVNF
jgi:hypothetical protein